MMKKKLMTLVLALVLCLGVVPSMTACGKKSDISVMLMINNKENAFYSQHFKKIGKEMGITIGYDGVVSANYYDSLKVAKAKGDMPDIFYVRPSNIRQYLADGWIADISEEIKEYTRLNDMHESAKKMFQYDAATKTFGTGKTYALPKDLSVQQLGYNVALVFKNRSVIWNAFEGYTGDYPKYPAGHEFAGKLKMPWDMDWEHENYTWTHYQMMAAALGKNGKTNGNTGDTIYGCDFPSYELLMWSFGDELLTGDKVNVDSEAFQKAGKYLAKLYDTGAARYRGATYNNFVGEQNVCFYSGVNSFDIINYDTVLGKFDGKDFSKGWDVMPWPVADPSGDFSRVDGEAADPTDWLGIITTAGYAVSADCQDKKKAVEIIMTLYRAEVQQDLVQNRKLQLPLFTDTLYNSFLNKEFDETFSPLSRKVYMDVIEGKNGRIGAEYTCYDSQWLDRIGTSLMEKVYLPEGSGDEAAKKAWDANYGTAFINDVQKLYDDFNKDKA